jgi:predicted dehydrogenase/threonine dehydrogenase-like Zn-dependent dehydrogenase
MQKNLLKRANVTPEEVPAPRCGPRSVLIANRYSLISAGTETSSVKRNVRDMVVKAMTDPELRQSVADMLLKDGIRKTADRVHYEATKWTPLGYSGCGVALEVGAEVEGIRRGDLVAYGGEGHAELIRASKNLCVKVPEGVSPRDAAFVALGSIALQAVRRAEIQVGDNVAVIGLGLVGQLVVQLLKAAGARVFGVDMIVERLEIARQSGAEHCLRTAADVPREIVRLTGGIGADRILVCASTASNEVIEQAIEMARDRGRIVLVGFVGLDVPQEKMYMKELDLVVSRSYGPGRYDADYEQHGNDYPIGYVRWTENRNMQEFLRLIQGGQVRIEPLATHEFSLGDSAEAYDQLIAAPAACLGILLRYDEQPPVAQTRAIVTGRAAAPVSTGGVINVAVVGCGGFARQFHLPNLKASRDLHLRAMVASSGQSAKEMGARYGADYCSARLDEALTDDAVDAVMILTRDNSHARMTADALRAGKHVFCEKPLCVSLEECEMLAALLSDGGPLCTVGFNRRFAPLIVELKKLLAGVAGPRMCLYRVNAGRLERDNWIYDPNYGRGRVLGEVCHFIDLLYDLIGAEPISVSAHALGTQSSECELEDLAAVLRFADGSVANLVYTASGTTSYAKERLEMFCGGNVYVLDDFRRLTVRGSKRLDLANRSGDKGHAAELAQFAAALKGTAELRVSHVDGLRATLACLAICESARSGRAAEPVAIRTV